MKIGGPFFQFPFPKNLPLTGNLFIIAFLLIGIALVSHFFITDRK